MTLTITGRRLKVPAIDQADIRQKMRSLDRILNSHAVSAACVISEERQQFVCELSIRATGDRTLHAVGRHAAIAGAVAAAVDKLAPQAKRLTDRWKAKRRDRSLQVTEPLPRVPALPPVTVPKVVKVRGYAPKAMTVAEASLELASSQGAVLVFTQATTGCVSVLFRRPDGAFGLIETTSA